MLKAAHLKILYNRQGFGTLTIIIFLALLSSIAVAAYFLFAPKVNIPTTSQLPSSAKKVVILIPNKKVFGEFEQGVTDRLKQLGYKTGENIIPSVVETNNAAPDFQDKINEVVLSQPQVIVAFTGELVVPVYKTELTLKKQVPLVAAAGFDLRDIGITDYTGSKTFVAGVVGNTQEINKKRLAVSKQVLPNLKNLGMITNPKQPTYEASIEPLKEAANSLGVNVIEYKVTSQEEMDTLLKNLNKEDIDLLYTSGQGIIVQNLDKIFTAATNKGIPTLDFRPNTPEKVLINYAHSYYSLGEGAANQVDKILDGQNVGDLPFEQPKSVSFTINLKIADKLGVKVPEEILLQTDKIIK